MREHQIVVNLKAQQFEQLQKLARERGFKSVTAYVKQKVLELAMGLADDASGRAHVSMSEADLVAMASSPAIGDLQRIHLELKSFLDELSGPTELPSVPPVSGAGMVGGFEVGLPDDDFGWASSRSDSMQINSTPAVNNSGAASSFGVGPPQINFNLLADSDASEQIGQPSYDSPASASAPRADSSPVEEKAPQVLPSSNLGGFGFGLGSFSSYGNSSARFQSPFASGDRLSGYRDIMDDMEELADRAFAISPRLGALDENAEVSEPEDSGRGRRPSNETAFVEPMSPANLPFDDLTGADDDADDDDNDNGAALSRAEETARELDQFLGAAEVSGEIKNFAPETAVDELGQDPPGAEQSASEQPVSELSGTEQPGTEPPAETKEVVVKERVRRRSNTLFEEPMLPPPDDEERTPTFIPPPAPLPPRASYTDLPALAPVEEPPEDDLLDELLDGNLHAAAQSRREDEPNPFAVSLSFELQEQARAQAEQEAAGSVFGGLADAVAGLASENSASAPRDGAASAHPDTDTNTDTDIDTDTDTVIDAAALSEKKDEQSTSGARPAASAGGDSQGDGTNPSTFSGTPPPKRRRT